MSFFLAHPVYIGNSPYHSRSGTTCIYFWHSVSNNVVANSKCSKIYIM